MKPRKLHKNNTTGFRGVWWHRRDRCFVVSVWANGKRTDVGRYIHLKQAVACHQRAVAEL